MSVEWIDNGQIAVFTVQNATRTAIEEFVNDIKVAREQWDKSKPFFTVFDVSGRDVLLTPYARQQMNELADSAPPDLYGAYALVLPAGVFSTIIQAFMRLFPPKQPAFKSQMFRDRESAITWLREQVAEYRA